MSKYYDQDCSLRYYKLIYLFLKTTYSGTFKNTLQKLILKFAATQAAIFLQHKASISWSSTWHFWHKHQLFISALFFLLVFSYPPHQMIVHSFHQYQIDSFTAQIHMVVGFQKKKFKFFPIFIIAYITFYSNITNFSIWWMIIFYVWHILKIFSKLNLKYKSLKLFIKFLLKILLYLLQ